MQTTREPQDPSPGQPGGKPLLPEGARRTAAWCAVALLVTGVGAVAVWLCIVFKSAVTPTLLALLGTALLAPVFEWLIRMKVPRALAAALTCVALIAVVGGAGYIVVKALIDTGDQIVDSVQVAGDWIREHFGITGADDLGNIADNAKQLLAKWGSNLASGVLAGLTVLGSLLATSVLALLLTFFFLKDSDRAVGLAHAVAPRGTGEVIEAMGRRAFQAVSGFMRGTTFIALIDAVCITVGLLILRVPGAVGLGALVLVGAYIPYLGATISGAVAVLVALADRGFAIALWALVVILAVQQLEGHILQPMIQSRTVQMHPALVMLAITAGASVAGILGMLLAVPVTAAAFGIIGELRGRYAPEGSDAPDDSPDEPVSRETGPGPGPASASGPASGS
ncbi:AI-2E family transporter [Streptomyces sp. VRA16 Mangrove soil]|uniref:AI-2E family transporter n=1 Tax=Streptomyces sp. VRA16 Mangrove soil TaxID=2817434 RepID=UPI001A9F4540|nr:AI-2E family transporter [Streptomyces sp. VRA16 Mangrove soil]MBO1333563.1 AI-2E family transporter [Streptomyces sp. VRA16 Mangrove soil]